MKSSPLALGTHQPRRVVGVRQDDALRVGRAADESHRLAMCGRGARSARRDSRYPEPPRRHVLGGRT